MTKPLPPLDLNLLQYASPEKEQSFFKNIPIQYLKEVQGLLGSQYKGLRYVFRGPRYDLQRAFTLKRHAHSFAVYKR